VDTAEQRRRLTYSTAGPTSDPEGARRSWQAGVGVDSGWDSQGQESIMPPEQGSMQTSVEHGDWDARPRRGKRHGC